jgi:hypothetical protein
MVTVHTMRTVSVGLLDAWATFKASTLVEVRITRGSVKDRPSLDPCPLRRASDAQYNEHAD